MLKLIQQPPCWGLFASWWRVRQLPLKGEALDVSRVDQLVSDVGGRLSLPARCSGLCGRPIYQRNSLKSRAAGLACTVLRVAATMEPEGDCIDRLVSVLMRDRAYRKNRMIAVWRCRQRSCDAAGSRRIARCDGVVRAQAPLSEHAIRHDPAR